MEDLRIAELLCTRLCHDITGPVGAINNGVEFLAENGGEMQEQAVELIASSASEAVRRIKYYRQAYGRVNAGGEANLEELRAAAADFYHHSKTTLDWPDTQTTASGVAISRRAGKVLLNMLIIAGESLIRGGTLAVRLEEEGGNTHISVTAAGKSVKLDPETEAALYARTPIDDLVPKTAQPYLTALLARGVNGSLTHALSDGQLRLVLTKPSQAA